MFSSLKHPARRKILRVLSEKPLTFSEMLDLLGISSSNLTYHLESLGELLTQENGVYKLSTFGSAAVSTMKIVEEAPEIQPKKHALSLKWKTGLAVSLIALVIVASAAVWQFNALNQASSQRNALQQKYNQLLSWTPITSKAIDFLQQVTQIDTSHYQATLVSNVIDQPSDLGGILEQTVMYSLTSSDSKMDVYFRLRSNELSWYQIIMLDGSPVYSQPQPYSALDAAKGLLSRLAGYENASYLGNMNSMLSLVSNSMQNMEITEGNNKLNVTVSGDITQIVMIYTENGVDFSPKCVSLTFESNELTDFIDDYYLFTIGSTTVDVSSTQAIQLAMNAVKGYSWTANGTTVSSFTVLSEPVSIVFHPNTKNGLALYPQWIVTLYLDKVYPGGVNSLTVLIWADTGRVAQIQNS
jgi:hypothetical protein